MGSAEVIWKRSDLFLNAWGRKIDCSCRVRTLENGLRGRAEVVYSYKKDGSRGWPYQPKPIPNGKWLFGEPKDKAGDLYAEPWFLPIGCSQKIETWSLVEVGDHFEYDSPTGEFVDDWEYGAHCCAPLIYTLGCIRIEKVADVVFMKGFIFAALAEKKDSFIEIID